MPLAPNSAAATISWYNQLGIPQIELPDGRLIQQPHREWSWHNLRWRWLLDSWEGGETYRMAVYGFDLRGMPVRNLIRHKREYPAPNDQTYSLATGRPPGTDAFNQATDDDYELRRARTPVPSVLADVIDRHLSTIFKKEIVRDGPDLITQWWEDVDGRGTSIDQWIIDNVAPLLLLLGQLDFLIDHPCVPDGETVVSKADQIRLKLGSAVAQYVLPENVVWWEVDRFGCYKDIVIREMKDDGDVTWRYWNDQGWQLYDGKGAAITEFTPHPFGRVPVIRVFDRRRPRFTHIGLPRYEPIAELMREMYNRDSELILSDTTQAHPLLQGPSDFVTPDNTIPIGPNWMLPKLKVTAGSGQPFYEAWEVLDFPKGGAESIRLNKNDILEAIDRSAHIVPMTGKSRGMGVTGLSGLAKRLDSVAGNDMLAKLASMLERAEQEITELAWAVLTDGKPKDSSVKATKVIYPREFDLFTSEEMLGSIAEFQACVAGSGATPLTDTKMLCKAERLLLPGLEDDEYAVLDAEIEAAVQSRADMKAQAAEGGMAGLQAMDSGSGTGPTPLDPEMQKQQAAVEAYKKRATPPPMTVTLNPGGPN